MVIQKQVTPVVSNNKCTVVSPLSPTLRLSVDNEFLYLYMHYKPITLARLMFQLKLDAGMLQHTLEQYVYNQQETSTLGRAKYRPSRS